eukprot:CAMPEP_0174251870 /NCGR_PEP_ID=MMETSP0439-20130205/1561_1 /TAXON_ID=0 /ORGANISM="Stereomyxa ramosa, Strain Chinc5" /LENGTH=458 /DNA_ID=CAMNT_0015332307 /DNA_START=24 /DNA_END=1400 /DNA_ORIENTATION=+
MRLGAFVFAFLCLVSFTFAQAKIQAFKGDKSCTGECLQPAKSDKMYTVMNMKTAEWNQCMREGGCPNTNVKRMSEVSCTNNKAGEYPCSNIDLLSFIPLSELGFKAGDGNDIWGWTDSRDNKEYAIMGLFEGTTFVDVTDPTAPAVIGYLPTYTVYSSWRDIKVYKDHAFIISEAVDHGMQVFDLRTLKDLPRDKLTKLSETAYYDEFGSCHNIVINEDTGRAYGVGSRTCRGGLHIIDISNPVEPQFLGCFSDDAYVHDAECVVYNGPDTRFTGQEICFCFNEDTLTVVAVDSLPATMIARVPYTGSQYTHQGWLSKNQDYLLLNDELDESYGKTPGGRTRTLIWDVSKVDKPTYLNDYLSSERSIDHNLYILGDTAYLANYCAGLRIYDVTSISTGDVSEIAYFDVAPDCATTSFLGSWSVYPYFSSGNLVVSSIDRGLFVLKHNPQSFNSSLTQN